MGGWSPRRRRRLPATPNDLATNAVGPRHPPGLLRQDDGAPRPQSRRRFAEAGPPRRDCPPDVQSDPFAVADTVDLMPWLLGAAFALLLADMIIALALRGLLSGWRRPGATGAVAGLAMLLLLLPAAARAQGTDPDKFAHQCRRHHAAGLCRHRQ